jgi:hypothetical protein
LTVMLANARFVEIFKTGFLSERELR